VVCFAVAERTFCIDIVQPMNVRSIDIVQRRNIRRRGKRVTVNAATPDVMRDQH
jgi:hypothetical protein